MNAIRLLRRAKPQRKENSARVPADVGSDTEHLTEREEVRYEYSIQDSRGGICMLLRDDRVLDTVMLESLAVIAAANDRTLVEELNRAVEVYVLHEFASHGESQLLEQAVAEQADSK